MRLERFVPQQLATKASGGRTGYWNMSESSEAFLDQLITWRELGFNLCAQTRDYETFASLPDWARQSLTTHAKDPRPYTYDLRHFESAKTHDPIWNAAQTQLLREGRLHGYLRMLWGMLLVVCRNIWIFLRNIHI